MISYNVFDSKSGRFIGTTYFDLYPRPGKFSHFANFPLLPARKLPDGTYRPPVTAILGNWPRPAPGSSALLSHEEVITFFHEFGHNLAALSARRHTKRSAADSVRISSRRHRRCWKTSCGSRRFSRKSART